MELLMLLILVTLWASVADAWGHSRHATHVQVETFYGTPFPPSSRVDQPDDDTPPPLIPIGQPRGPINPSSPAINLIVTGGGKNSTQIIPRAKRQQCGGKGIVFDISTVYSSNTAIGTNGSPAEPSGAKAGKVIFTTSNWLAAISIDGGATFNNINPTVYAGPVNSTTDAGFCCDQVVQYLPSIDRFVWLMQYNKNANNVNRLRLITFHPSDVDKNGINSWIYMDIVSSALNFNSWLDYGELAVGNTQLYLSATVIGKGLVVFRIPIDSLNVVGTLTYRYTNMNDGVVAQSSRLAQNPGDTAFWAGHSKLGTTMRIFKWPESSIDYFWNDIRIDDWPSANPSNPTTFFSACPQNASASWVFGNLANAIIGATRRSSNEVWFAWNAPYGGGFANPHVQIAQIDVGGWPGLKLIKQWQIWNPKFAFSYPALYTNVECGDVGLAVGFGGGTFNPTGAVGVMDSNGVVTQTVYYPELSNTCEFRYGDYLAVRSEGSASYEGFVYAIQNTDSAVERNPRFVEFGRG